MKKNNNYSWIVVLVIIGFFFLPCILGFMLDGFVYVANNISKGLFGEEFRLVTTLENKDMEETLVKYAKKNKIHLTIEYADDLEIVEKLNNGEEYDAVWVSNSIWLYMLNSDVYTSKSKSISINPVVFGIKKSKASELGFVDKEVYNKDIIDAIRYKGLKYVMPSAIKTNAGATAYLGFLKNLSNKDGILTVDDLDNTSLQDDLKSLFSGVERVSGTEDFLESMFLNSDEYDAVISSETSLIRINQERIKQNKEPLYLIYPKDGVAINDSPFAYISRKQGKEEQFEILQKYLLSAEGAKKLESLGRRVWYGGVNEDADPKVFNKEWGIDTSKYLMSLRYPSKAVITRAFSLYVDVFRKPAIVVFCLDFSGSMYGEGISQLRNAIEYIFDYEKAVKDLIQFTDKDKVYIIPFNSKVMSNPIGGVYDEYNKSAILSQMNSLTPGGGTNIYAPTIKALELIDNEDSNEYTKTVVLMTDGYSNSGRYSELANYYKLNNLNIPVYSIMFGSSSRSQLQEIANLTNALVFDGVSNLTEAFKTVRSFN